ncbi:MAG: hypothetical protein AAF799_00785 [Myxococcota bacterium]
MRSPDKGDSQAPAFAAGIGTGVISNEVAKEGGKDLYQFIKSLFKRVFEKKSASIAGGTVQTGTHVVAAASALALGGAGGFGAAQITNAPIAATNGACQPFDKCRTQITRANDHVAETDEALAESITREGELRSNLSICQEERAKCEAELESIETSEVSDSTSSSTTTKDKGNRRRPPLLPECGFTIATGQKSEVTYVMGNPAWKTCQGHSRGKTKGDRWKIWGGKLVCECMEDPGYIPTTYDKYRQLAGVRTGAQLIRVCQEILKIEEKTQTLVTFKVDGATGVHQAQAELRTDDKVGKCIMDATQLMKFPEGPPGTHSFSYNFIVGPEPFHIR